MTESETNRPYARYHRMLGQDVFFMTGADEHGSWSQLAPCSTTFTVLRQGHTQISIPLHKLNASWVPGNLPPMLSMLWTAVTHLTHLVWADLWMRQKIAQVAENEGLQPIQICDRYCSPSAPLDPLGAWWAAFCLCLRHAWWLTKLPC